MRLKVLVALCAALTTAPVRGSATADVTQRVTPAPKPWPSVPLPSLTSDPPDTVRLKACAVSVVAGHVTLELSVSMVGDTAALLLDGALFGWGGSSDPYPNRQFPELQIRVDSSSRLPEDRFEAFLGRRNVTTMLEMAGLDAWAITRTAPLTTPRTQNAPLLKALVNVGALEKSGDEYLAKWQARRIVRIPLEPAPLHSITLDYQARPAVMLTSLEGLDTSVREKNYCLSPAQLRRLHHRGSGSTWVATEYTLPAGIDRLPPKSVTLRVSSAAGDVKAPSWIFFCGRDGRSHAKRGAIARDLAGVDESASLHVLSLAESTEISARD